jgi:hypothetical protein
MAENTPLDPTLYLIFDHIRPKVMATNLALKSLLRFLSLRRHLRRQFLQSRPTDYHFAF